MCSGDWGRQVWAGARRVDSEFPRILLVSSGSLSLGALAPACAGTTLLSGPGGCAGTEGPPSHVPAHQGPAPSTAAELRAWRAEPLQALPGALGHTGPLWGRGPVTPRCSGTLRLGSGPTQ